MTNIKDFIRFLKEIWIKKKGNGKKQILVPFTNTHRMNIIKWLYAANYFAEKTDATIYAYCRYDISKSRASQIIKEIYQAGNVKDIVDFKLTEQQQLVARKLCDEIWDGLYSWKDWNDITVYGIPFGTTIIRTFFRFYIPSTDIRDEKMHAYLQECVNTIVFWYNYIYENEISIILLVDGAIWDGYLRDIAVTKNIPVYSITERIDRLGLNCGNIRAKVYPNMKGMWDQLTQEEQKCCLDWAKTQIEKRLQGETDEVWPVLKEKFTFAIPIKEKGVLERNEKINVLICPHIFEEDSLGSGVQIFDNNYISWLEHLGELSEITPEYDWYLKMHPHAHGRDPFIINMILDKYPKIKKLPADISPMQLKDEGVKFALTVHGSIGHEFPQIGIQVINAGANPHMSFDFTWNPTSKEEYDSLILNLDKLDKKVDMEELYKFYSLYYLLYDFEQIAYDKLFLDNPVLLKQKAELNANGFEVGTWLYREFMNSWSPQKHEYILRGLGQIFQEADEWKPDVLYKKKIEC